MLSIIVSWFLYQAAAPAADAGKFAALEIEVVADSSLAAFPRKLELVEGCPGDPARPPRKSTFPGDRFTVPALPFDCYQAAVTIERETRADLAFPGVRPAHFDFRKVRVSGRVTRADSGVSASLTFTPVNIPSGGPVSTPASAESDEGGEYETRLWRGALYGVHVEPREGAASISRFHLLTSEEDEQHKDFALSANSLVVEIVDAKTGEPVSGARLVYLDADGSQAPRVDTNGTVTIESIPSGPFHATAVSKDHVNKTEDWTLEDREEPQTFRIEMQPRTEGNEFQVLLPDGSPAAGAFGYYRFDPGMQTRVSFRCDEQGICHPDERPGANELVYLSHNAAGLTILPAGQIYQSNSAMLWPAGGPLVVKIKPGPGGNDKCEFVLATINGAPIEQTSNWTCGAAPGPVELGGLPAGPIGLTIVTHEIDDHGRSTEDVVLAGPVTVTLPSDPIEIAIP
ncbi:MAG: hypothetical protein ACRD16_02225 [Thermoanaerobaculia bacterium]